MTLFQLTQVEDLKYMHERLTQALTHTDQQHGSLFRCLVRGGPSIATPGLGLAVAIIVDDGVTYHKRCFCATLIQSPELPLDSAIAIPVVRYIGSEADVTNGAAPAAPARATTDVSYAQVTG
eukprot:CAMPEP_0202455888 /NCGR_PEP_ID=MMETSP1360-20130828/13305_1 /ASSEMBLY_ACC=CAM_ASM_000848 /TAXON_ID=515479 /ORGANISM="Licmophora paradoxa, Strain CCMP2313" /LENGTH=121 /DNA_ID=CAMNT_0049075573 /DNA_START=131 /DNA_END=496 /DNA_ORIENTATION=+